MAERHGHGESERPSRHAETDRREPPLRVESPTGNGDGYADVCGDGVPMKQLARVLAAVEAGAQTFDVVAIQAGISQQAASSYLSVLAADALIVREGDAKPGRKSVYHPIDPISPHGA